MTWKPEVAYIGREERPSTPSGRPMGSFYGDVFEVSLNPLKMPDALAQNQMYRDALNANPDAAVLSTIREVDLQIIHNAIVDEEWVVWLDNQEKQHNGGEWRIPNSMNMSLGPLLIEGAAKVRVTIAEDKTATLFKLTFA